MAQMDASMPVPGSWAPHTYAHTPHNRPLLPRAGVHLALHHQVDRHPDDDEGRRDVQGVGTQCGERRGEVLKRVRALAVQRPPPHGTSRPCT
eukprot:105512-Chlamydomonas_euryale.AAC.2